MKNIKMAPKNKINLQLKMTNCSEELNVFLQEVKDFNFKRIDVELGLIECNRLMSMMILSNKDHNFGLFTFLATESKYLNLPLNKERLLVFRKGLEP
jgi:hypothetical protein